jgi:Flp pilus assembly protein TadB
LVIGHAIDFAIEGVSPIGGGLGLFLLRFVVFLFAGAAPKHQANAKSKKSRFHRIEVQKIDRTKIKLKIKLPKNFLFYLKF